MKPQWGAIGLIDHRTAKFHWANPEDSYYTLLSFRATAFWDGGRWVRIMRKV